MGNLGSTVSAPVAISGLSGVAAISAGTGYSCAALVDGTAACLGDNSVGELGNGTITNSSTPVAVTGLTGATAIAAAGGTSTMHSCAALTGGAVSCWGFNGSGELGNGTMTSSRSAVAVSGLSGAMALAAGASSSCALVSGGSVSCWGLNPAGANQLVPTSVPGLSNGGAIAIDVNGGGDHGCALMSDGTVKCWGSNSAGELGNGSTNNSSTAVTVSGVSSATAVATGLQHACAVVSGGAVVCWGLNAQGQLGNGTTTGQDAGACASSNCWETPVAVPGLSGAIAVVAGVYHTCALLSDGNVKCWGANANGELGNGTTTNSPTPVTVAW
jgi:alpha-tubulin suppressor-like RCC1 family protein